MLNNRHDGAPSILLSLSDEADQVVPELVDGEASEEGEEEESSDEEGEVSILIIRSR